MAAKSFWFRILGLLGRLFLRGVQSSGECWINKWFFIIIILLPCLYMWEVFRYTLFQAPYREASSFREVTSGRLSLLRLYRLCGKLGVPSYTMMKTLTWLWDLLVHTVKGDYDSYKSFGNTTNRKRRLWRVWSSIPIMLVAGADVRWTYIPPRWLFPPPAPFLVRTTWVNMEEATYRRGF